MGEHVEPLAADLWFQQLEKVAEGSFRSTENALRHMSHLLQLAPAEFRPLIRLPVEEDRFEALLQAGKTDTAARVLIAEPASLSIALNLDGGFHATITCFDRVFTRGGRTRAAAVLAALTDGLLALRSLYAIEAVSGTVQCSHINPHEQGPLLS